MKLLTNNRGSLLETQRNLRQKRVSPFSSVVQESFNRKPYNGIFGLKPRYKCIHIDITQKPENKFSIYAFITIRKAIPWFSDNTYKCKHWFPSISIVLGQPRKLSMTNTNRCHTKFLKREIDWKYKTDIWQRTARFSVISFIKRNKKNCKRKRTFLLSGNADMFLRHGQLKIWKKKEDKQI